jgi:hypothetical protein
MAALRNDASSTKLDFYVMLDAPSPPAQVVSWRFTATGAAKSRYLLTGRGISVCGRAA